MKNAYRGLLSRGLKGCHVDFTNDRTRDLVESSVDRLAAALAVEHDPATKESGHE